MLKQYLIDAAIENAEEKAQSMQSRIELQVPQPPKQKS